MSVTITCYGIIIHADMGYFNIYYSFYIIHIRFVALVQFLCSYTSDCRIEDIMEYVPDDTDEKQEYFPMQLFWKYSCFFTS